MNRLDKKNQNSFRRRNRVRARISGTKEQPRLSVKISISHITAQVINDEQAVTLAHITTYKFPKGKTMMEKAEWVGGEIAKAAKAKKIKKVVFDRNSKAYHGRVKVLADAARKEGLEF